MKHRSDVILIRARAEATQAIIYSKGESYRFLPVSEPRRACVSVFWGQR